MIKNSFSLRVHPLLWLMAFTAVATGYFRELLIIFFLVLLHEGGHLLAAKWFGWRVSKVELFPFGGVLHTNQYGNAPLHQELLVALMGPLQHVWLLCLPYSFLQSTFHMDANLYQFWMSCNLSMLLFNLLPLFPLDGGRVLYALVSFILSYQRSFFVSFVCSCLTGGLFVLLLWLKSLHSLNIWCIAVFIVFTHWELWKKREYAFIQFLIERMATTALPVHPLRSSSEESIRFLLRRLHRGKKARVTFGESVLWDHDIIAAYYVNGCIHCNVGDVQEVLRNIHESGYNTPETWRNAK
ncbi:site-2 protease family protein [Aureibacillus halotolerans]|uniref:Sporulation factor SpoIVFB n=1 Tax=Aureibacillus halotolerans TaxID=1508390 RepID=A0A4R6TXE5_9BACI|nr:site-2 protease family protein [Aureibacillus halotolerans]TDQ37966.1 sporulation factor SpoIVFB [Aureibacillus halotolerans]